MLADIDIGQDADETRERQSKREALVAQSPAPQFFKLRAELLAQGRSNQLVSRTDNMRLNLKIYATGGENGLHNHTDQDHFHLILSGRALFYGPRGETRSCGPYEGVMLPAGSYYRFHAAGDEPLVLLRVGCRVGAASIDSEERFNIYGDALPSDSKENGRGPAVRGSGAFWGAA